MSKRLKTRLSITNQTRTATTDVSRVVLLLVLTSRVRQSGCPRRAGTPGRTRPAAHGHAGTFWKLIFESPRGPGAARATAGTRCTAGPHPRDETTPTPQMSRPPRPAAGRPRGREPRAQPAPTVADPERKGRSHAGAGHGARGAASHCHWPSHGAHAPVDTHSVSLPQRGVVYYFACL